MRFYEQLCFVLLESLEEMDRFLQKYKSPKTEGRGSRKPNRPITSKEIEAIIKKLAKKNFMTRWVYKFYQTLHLILRLLQNISERNPS